jgi:hypothetical protein
MLGESESLDLSMEADFEIVERDGEVLAGFESSGESPEFDDMHQPERWLEYLLDPGDGASPVSEKYHENTTALQLVGLTLVDELLEYDETREAVMEYQEDIEEMTLLGYSEELRSYASDVLMKMEEN